MARQGLNSKECGDSVETATEIQGVINAGCQTTPAREHQPSRYCTKKEPAIAAGYKSSGNCNKRFKSELKKKKVNKFRVTWTEQYYLRHVTRFPISPHQPVPSLGFCTPKTDVTIKSYQCKRQRGWKTTYRERPK